MQVEKKYFNGVLLHFGQKMRLGLGSMTFQTFRTGQFVYRPETGFFCDISINAFLRTLTFNRLIVLESSSAFVECVLKTQTKKNTVFSRTMLKFSVLTQKSCSELFGFLLTERDKDFYYLLKNGIFLYFFKKV